VARGHRRSGASTLIGGETRQGKPTALNACVSRPRARSWLSQMHANPWMRRARALLSLLAARKLLRDGNLVLDGTRGQRRLLALRELIPQSGSRLGSVVG